MQRLVQGIINLSPPLDARQDEAAHQSLLSELKNAVKDVKGATTGSDIANALDALDPLHHSAGYGCILALAVDGEAFLADGRLPRQACQWMLNCHAEAIQCIPLEVATIARTVGFTVDHHPIEAQHALKPLLMLLEKSQTSAEHMSPIHSAVFKTALLLNNCYHAHQILRNPIYDLGTSGLTATDYLLYCYYGALVCIVCKDLSRASELLLLAVTMPTPVADAIIIAAWHKYCLVHTLQTGDVPEIPKHTPFPTTRMLRDTGPLHSFLACYSRSNSNEMVEVLNKEKEFFVDAGLLGLAKQLLDRLVTQIIHRLTSMYLTLSLEGIAQEASLESAQAAELQILKMIGAGEMRAKIDEVAGMVSFEEQSQEDATSLVTALKEKTNIIMDLQTRIAAAAQEATLDPRYAQKLLSQERVAHRAAGRTLFGAPLETSF